MSRSVVAVLAAWTLAAFVARGAFSDLFRIGGIRPDLLILVVFYWALSLGPVGGTIVGFLVGLVADAELGRALGVQAGLLSLFGFVVGQAAKRLVRENLLMQAAVLGGGTLALSGARLLLVLGGGPGAFFGAAWLPILGQALYTALLGPAVYALIRILRLPDPLRGAFGSD